MSKNNLKNATMAAVLTAVIVTPVFGLQLIIALIPMKAMSIIGSYVGNLTELQELMELVRAGKVPPMPVHRHALAEADRVLSALRAGKVVGRAVLTVD